MDMVNNSCVDAQQPTHEPYATRVLNGERNRVTDAPPSVILESMSV